jgi:hypothetical protein
MAFVSTSGVCRSWQSAHIPLANLVRPFDSPCYLSREHFTRHRCIKEPEAAAKEEKEGEEKQQQKKMKMKQKNRDIKMGL